MAQLSNDKPTTDRAVAQLREIAHYLDEHAESIVGDMDNVYILEGGLRVSFPILDDASIPTLTVTREHLVMREVEL